MPTTYARLAGEQNPGTDVAANTLSTKKCFVQATEVQVARGEQFMNRDDEMRFLTEGVPLVMELFSPTWSLKSRLYPDVLGQVLANAFGIAATGETGATHYAVTTGNGIITDPDSVTVPTGAYKHVWTAPFGPSGVTPKTAEIDGSYGQEGIFMVARGAMTDTIAIETPDTGGALLTASGPALYADTQSDPSLTPSLESVNIRPFMRGGLAVVTWLTGSSVADSIDLTIGLPADAVRSLGAASKYPNVAEKGDALMSCTGSIDVRHIDQQDLDALKAGTEFAAKLRWTSDSIIASLYPYKFFAEFSAAQYTGGDLEAMANRRRMGAKFPFRASRNAAASVTLTLVNATASYA